MKYPLRVLFVSVSYLPGKLPSDKQFINDLICHLPKDVYPAIWTMNEAIPIRTTLTNADKNIPFVSVNRFCHRAWCTGNKGLIVHRHNAIKNLIEISSTVLCQSINSIRELVEEHKPQILHITDDLGPGLYILSKVFSKLAITCAKPSIDKFRGLKNVLYNYRIRWGAGSVNRIIAFSELCRDRLYKYGIKKPVDVIPWGIIQNDIKLSHKRLEKIRSELGCNKGEILVIGSPRRLDDNLHEAIIAALRASQNNRLRFVFCIKPTLWKESYQSLSNGKLSVIPSPPQFYDLLEAADALFAPQGKTTRSSLPPLLWLEAMWRGTPVITETNPGVCETITNEVSGLLYETARAAPKTLEKLGNSDLLNKMKANAMNSVSIKYNIEHIAHQYTKTWRTLL